MLILLFGVRLGRLPTSGYGGVKHMVLPAVTLAFPAFGRLVMMVRSTMIDELHPDSVGGALLLGVDGVCVISHGSSTAGAMLNAIRVASEMVEAGMVEHLTATAR